MMLKNSAIKRLAGETAVYGMSTILARVLNFLLVPLYTRVLTDQAAYGVVAEFMAYIAVLQVVLVLGLETGCFRFASLAGQKNDPVGAGRVFSTSLYNGNFCSRVVFCRSDPFQRSHCRGPGLWQ